MTIPKELLGYVAVFDTETAILGDHVIEVGFSTFRNAKLDREWGSFVKNMIPIDPDASKVHNIYENDLIDAPTFAEIGWFIHNQLSVADIHIAYNYEYDRKVLESEFARLGMEFPVRPVVDPFIFFKQYHKYNKGKKLINAAEVYGIPYVGAHRAVNDATVTGKVLFKIAAVKNNFPRNLDVLQKKQREWVEAQFIDLSNYFQKQGRDPLDPIDFSVYDPVTP